MKESELRAQINKLLKRIGFWPLTGTDAFVCHKCGHVSRPPKGRPDTLCLHQTQPSIVIEYKMLSQPGASGYASASFNTRSITEAQRVWLSVWNDGHAGCGSWLGIGTRHGHAGSFNEPRRAWLVPWDKYYELETLFIGATGFLSIPLLPYKGMKQGRLIRDHQLWACYLFEPWELRWKKGWWFKENHPLYQAYGGYRELAEQKERWKYWRKVAKGEAIE